MADGDVPRRDARVGGLLLASPGVATRGMRLPARLRAVAVPGVLLLGAGRGVVRARSSGRAAVRARTKRDVLAWRRNDPRPETRMDDRSLRAGKARLRLPPSMPGPFVPCT